VVFTHLHSDHAAPDQLMAQRYYMGPGGIPRQQKTTLVGPNDLLGPLRETLIPYLDIFRDEDGNVREGGVDAMARFRPTDNLEIGGVLFRWFRVPHVSGPNLSKPAYGLEIDDGSKKVLWSGDTTFAPDWIQAAAEDPRVAAIFHECTFGKPFRGTVHTHFDELQQLDPDILARITLMHHTEVPAGVELGALAGAAARHASFEF